MNGDIATLQPGYILVAKATGPRGADALTKFGGLLIAVYLGLAPVYWLPGGSVSLLAAVKLGLVGSGVAMIWLGAALRNRLILPRGAVGPFGFMALITSATFGFLQADLSAFGSRLLDFVLGFAMLWTLFLYARLGGRARGPLLIAAGIVAAFALVTILSRVTGTPAWTAPAELSSAPLWVQGFGGTRTGWSNGIALYLPLMFCVAPVRGMKGNLPRLMALLGGVGAIVGSQVVVGGRAGLLLSMVVLLVWMLLAMRPIVSAAVLTALLVAALSLSSYLYTSLRFDRFEGLRASTSTLDSFSAGRISSYSLGLELAQARPLTGYGFGQIDLTNSLGFRDVHNLWLRMLVEAGAFLPATFLVVVLAAGYRAFQRVRIRSLRKPRGSPSVVAGTNPTFSFALICILGGGVLVSMFEPNVLLGSFQNSAVWWGAIGVLAALPVTRSVAAAPQVSEASRASVTGVAPYDDSAALGRAEGNRVVLHDGDVS